MKKNDVVTMLKPDRSGSGKLVKIAAVKFDKDESVRFKLKLDRGDRFFWFKGTVEIDIKYENNNMTINFAWENLQYPTGLSEPDDVYSIRFEKAANNLVNIYYRYVSGLEEGKFISLSDCDNVTLYSNQSILTKISDLNINPVDFLPSESIELLELDELHSKGVTGKGIKVAVIDNGLVKPNAKLEIKKSFSIDGKTVYGDHATSCASIIKSTEFGIAPDCDLYSVSTNDNVPSFNNVKKVAECINWCVDSGIDIISISLGIGEDMHLAELEEACMYAYKKGVIIVAGVGNDGNEKNDDQFDIKIPASYAYTISVANVDRSTEKISEISSRGYGIDFAGYGDGSKAYNVKGETYSFCGTSSATPYIAGCIALIKQQLPQLNMIEVYDILKDNAIKVDGNVKSTKYGYGLIKPILISKDYKYRNRDFLEAREALKTIYFEDIVINVSEGRTFRPSIKFYPNTDESSYVSFTSSNSDIVSVDHQNNIAKAIKEGSATITAIMRNGQIAQVKVNVIPSPISDSNNRKTLKDLGVYDAWNKGFKGEGIKVGYVGWGCIDTEFINIKERYNVYSSVDKKECGQGLGTQVSSLISGRGVGIAPNCEYYALNPNLNTSGMASILDLENCVEWAIDKKLDIVFIRNIEFTSTKYEIPESLKKCSPENIKKLLQKMHDQGIIVVTIIDEDSSNLTSSLTNTENTLTVSYVTDKKETSNDVNKKPIESPWVDCVGFGCGMNVLNVSEKEITITESDVSDVWTSEYYAAAQVCGILALLKQQNPKLKTAQDVRVILSEVCETLYNGKNNRTGYGLLKAIL